MTHPNISQTIRVGITRIPEWGAVGLVPGVVEHGIESPHQAANLKCGARIVLDPTQPNVTVGCRKGMGHSTPKGQKAHVPVDQRILAAGWKVVHTMRFAPGGLPAGVDQTITLPHDCDNHLV